ncbi:IclR family transcriptional regulator [Streptomyces lucensis JCM 4490]|uniref:IclR family transcriptional regulator n=1 Tax=Streptomyces lucensis JCM 4490 TaxID=1306176 RepID=A0A918MYJ0_9ACTN|nr:IclR family transcriptional regulator [Streptomyces lucensis]GGW82081.1 IclR family transcriptional regulator [Streptomyces lucensis JCM 4490]
MSAPARPAPDSGVGVLDKASIILDLIEQRPAGLTELVRRSGLTRPTVYRLAVAMERLDLLCRDGRGWFSPGPRLERLGVEAHHDRMAHVAHRVLADLRELSSFDVRLHRLHKGVHVCVAASRDPVTGMETLPVGTARPAKAGPIGQVLLAWQSAEELYEGLCGARFTAQHLARVRRTGWAYGFDDAHEGQAAFAVPVWNGQGRVVAALALVGARTRLPDVPEQPLRSQVLDTAEELGKAAPYRWQPPVPPRDRG